MTEENTAEATDTDAVEADTNEAEAQGSNYPSHDDASVEERVESSYISKDNETEEMEAKQDGSNRNYEGKVVSIAKARRESGEDISDKLKESGSTTRSLDEIVERNIEGQNVAWKELWYIVKGFLNTGDREEDHEIYKVIARKAKNGEPLTFLLPGLFQFPYTASDFEKYSGLDTVRIATRNPDEIHDILGYAAEKTKRGSILIGYSDGELRARDYVKRHGDGYISMFYGLESDKSHMERIMDPNRVRYIDGDGFLIRTLSPLARDFFAAPNAPLDKINGATHSGLVHNPYDIARVGSIIRETSGIKYLNFAQIGKPANDNMIKPMGFNFQKAA